MTDKKSTKAKTRNNLAALRKAKGWSQSAVGKFLGIQVTTVCRHETGDRNLTNNMVRQYAELYAVDPLELYFGEDEEGGLQVPEIDETTGVVATNE